MAFYRPPNPRRQKYANLMTVALVEKSNGSIAMQIRMGDNIRIGLGWSAGDRIEVRWGYRDDFGSISLVRLQRGGVGLRTKKGVNAGPSCWIDWATYPNIDLADAQGALWRFKREKSPAVHCAHSQLPDGSLKVELPHSWFEHVRDGKKSFGWSKAA